jgi:hypothetical protein
MRTFTLALLATAAMGLATSAMAQQTVNGPNQQPNIPQGPGNGDRANYFPDTVQDRYDVAILLLKKKVDRVTREDGGKLTPEHAAALQSDLDKLNRRFGRNNVASR